MCRILVQYHLTIQIDKYNVDYKVRVVNPIILYDSIKVENS